MVEHSRYSVSSDVAGVRGKLLKNKLGITDQKKLEDTETLLLADTYIHFFDLLKHRKIKFDLSLLYAIHRYFLGTLYAWAGKIRTVDISKDGILFAPAEHITGSLTVFEKMLMSHLPLSQDTKQEIVSKFAVIHIELNAIHPFREGNGRTIRLFIDLLAAQCGYAPIDYTKTARKLYVRACVAGMRKDYKKMERIIYRGLKRS